MVCLLETGREALTPFVRSSLQNDSRKNAFAYARSLFLYTLGRICYATADEGRLPIESHSFYTEMKIASYILSLAALGCLNLLPAYAAWQSPISEAAEKAAPCTLLPFPQQVEWQAGRLPFGTSLVMKDSPEDALMATATKGLKQDLRQYGKGEAPALTVSLVLKDNAVAKENAKEGYTLTINQKGVKIAAATTKGLFYGCMTLRQMLADSKKGLPYCNITDWPAFPVRGFMHDCGRNFQTIEALKKEIDLAARFKVNFFHWHLTDHPGWHVESKAYPVLNDPEKRTRDKNDTYTYKQIRELFTYAAARNIQIIPEIDMPGHSSYFERCFGFKMHEEKGMEVLEKALDEFCKEIPKELAPYFHIGADEVRVPNAKEFVSRMSNFLMARGRTPAQWGGPRDLPVGEHSICHRWGEGGEMVERSLKADSFKCPSFDSAIGYTNLFEPALLVRRYFFMRPCGVGRGDEKHLGPIVCTWNDNRVEDKRNIARHNVHWPGIMTMAERAWVGGDADGDALPTHMPDVNTPEGAAFARYEKRMLHLSRTIAKDVAFPYWKQSGMTWTLVEPVATKDADATRDKVLKGEMASLKTQKAYGASVTFRTRPDTGCLGLFAGNKPGVTTWAVTEIDSASGGETSFMMGFDAPARSNRRWSGVPKNGEWSRCGTRIWVNGKEIQNTRRYKLAGERECKGNSWMGAINETPYDDEEIWWAQEPTKLNLKKGKNTIVIEQPYVGEYQTWGVNLIPVKK